MIPLLLTPLWHLDRAAVSPTFRPDGLALHAIDGAGALRSHDARTGAVRWQLRAPDGLRFGGQVTDAGGISALTVDRDGYSRGVCRVGMDGKKRWCVRLDRVLSEPVSGITGSGIAVADQHEDLRLLDPATGAPMGEWIPGGEMHIYNEPGEPHDTIFQRSAVLLGDFGGTTVIATQRGLRGFRAGGEVWSGEISAAPVEFGGFGGGLVFSHAGAPVLAGAAGGAGGALFLIGDRLVGLGADGQVRFALDEPEAVRLVDLPGGPFLVREGSISALDAATGAPRWTTALTGFGAILGESGPIGWREPGDLRDAAVLLDAGGGVALTIPLRGETGMLSVHADSVLLGPTPERWSCLGPAGPRWAFTDRMGNAEVHAGVGVRYPNPAPLELIDLQTGAVLGGIRGAILASTGDLLLSSEEGGYTIYAAPRAAPPRP